ncbi:MAG: ABC transporter ATP-binding protein [Acholeplasmatales bacterium]|nr:ABC transporter ATP-binding protein [Acholeplasmatales bacterium]
MPPRMGNGERPKNNKNAFKNLARVLKPFKAFFVLAIICILLSVFVSILAPRLTAELTSGVMTNGANYIMGIDSEFKETLQFKILNYEIDTTIFNLGISIIIIYFVGLVFGYFAEIFFVVRITDKMGKNIRSDINNKIHKLPLSYFDTNPYGDTLSRITNDVDTLCQAFQQSGTTLIQSLFMIIGLPIAMFIVDWRLTLVCFISIPTSMIILMIIMKISRKYFIGQQMKLGIVNGYIEEMYAGQTVVKAFNAEEKTKNQFNYLNEALYKDNWKSQFLSGLMMPLMVFVANIVYALVLFVGGVIAKGYANPFEYFSVIILFVIYSRMFNNQFSRIGQVAGQLLMAGAAAERIFELLGEAEMEDESNKTMTLDNVKGDIRFEHVTFGYNPDKIIINDFNADIKAGSKIAIVGPTGAGKTTLVNLLMRFYEINSGKIYIDGIDIQSIKRSELHKVFSMVLQETWLFEGSVRDNLCFGRDDEVSEEELVEKATEAHIYHYISTMSKGFDTVLDESTTISQGQKQLFTIARAMIENAPMIILDEATSNIDTRTEILIQKAMDKLTKGRTSFVIAHRLQTIKDADLILVMNNGNIVEQGRHEELLAKKGFYADLYYSQFED